MSHMEIPARGTDYLLVTLIAVLHLWTLWAFGATYWFDTGIYAELGRALSSDSGLVFFYSGERYLWYQHLMPGAPLLWRIVDMIGTDYGWLTIVLFQKALAVLALVLFISSLSDVLRGAWKWLFALIASLYPFSVAFQNAVLTESISSSLFLISLALIINGVEKRDARPFLSVFVLTMVSMFLVQFRAYLTIIALLYFAVNIFMVNKRDAKAVNAIAIILILMSMLTYPALRWHATGHWFGPNVDILTVGHALYVNDAPGMRGLEGLQRLVYPDDYSLKDVLNNGMSHEQSVRIASHMIQAGYSESDVKDLFKASAAALRTERSDVMIRQLKLNLSSIGIIALPYIFNDEEIIRRGITNEQYKDQIERYFIWQSWLDESDYGERLSAFLYRFEERQNIYSPETVSLIRTALSSHVISRPEIIKDPLFLGRIQPDALVAAWALGMLTLWRRRAKLAVWLMTPVLLIYMISLYATVVGNIRYAHALIPIYIAGALLLMRFALEKCKTTMSSV